MKDKLEAYFGLPAEVKFCKKCVISNQRPSSTVEMKNKNKNDVSAVEKSTKTSTAPSGNVWIPKRAKKYIYGPLDGPSIYGSLLALFRRTHRGADEEDSKP